MCFHMLMNMSKFTFTFPKTPFTTGVCMFSFSGFFFFFTMFIKKRKNSVFTNLHISQIYYKSEPWNYRKTLFFNILEGPSPPFNVRNPEKYYYKNYCYDSLYDSFNWDLTEIQMVYLSAGNKMKWELPRSLK